MPDAGAAPRRFAVGGLRGETAGEGPAIVLCHGLTATRRSVVHGSRLLERAGHRLIVYDARGHGESDPAPVEEGYDYLALVADLARIVDSHVGTDRVVVGGHSMGAHTAIAYALRNPERIAGLVAIGPTYTGASTAFDTHSMSNAAEAYGDSLTYWDGLAAELEAEGVEGFVAYIDAHQEADPAWRDSVLRFTRERMLRHRHLDAVARALREVPRSAPFGSLDELERIEAPTLVVASGDAVDPGHPYAVAAAYAEAMPNAELISEAPGQSPLAWQGGRLSRAITAFLD